MDMLAGGAAFSVEQALIKRIIQATGRGTKAVNVASANEPRGEARGERRFSGACGLHINIGEVECCFSAPDPGSGLIVQSKLSTPHDARPGPVLIAGRAPDDAPAVLR